MKEKCQGYEEDEYKEYKYARRKIQLYEGDETWKKQTNFFNITSNNKTKRIEKNQLMREVGMERDEPTQDYVVWATHLQGYRLPKATAFTETFTLEAMELVSCCCTFYT